MSQLQADYATRGKTIFRVEKNADNPFVMIDRRPIENPSLSWRAKGILTYLISRPDNWIVRLGDLIKRSPDGVYAVRTALRELTKAGHLTRREEREQGKFKQYVLMVHEVPVTSTVTNLPQADKPQADNLTLNDTELNENKINEKERGDAAIFQALAELTGGGINSDTPRLVDTWMEKHTLFWVLKAVSVAKEKGARSPRYIDEILISWEANGYPKTREERVKEKRNGGRPPRIADKQANEDWKNMICPNCYAIPCQCEDESEAIPAQVPA
jgi:hypothetical protein